MNFWQLMLIIQLTSSSSSASLGRVMRNFAPLGWRLQVLWANPPPSSPDNWLPARSSPPESAGAAGPRDAGGRAERPVGGAAQATGSVVTRPRAATQAARVDTNRGSPPGERRQARGCALIGSGSPWKWSVPCAAG